MANPVPDSGGRRAALLRLWLAMALLGTPAAQADTAAFFAIEDRPLHQPAALPDWIEQDALDLPALQRQAAADKRGVLLYFWRRDCPYCEAHVAHNWGAPDEAKQTRAGFRVIGIDVDGTRRLIDLDGTPRSERDLALAHGVALTPTQVFLAPDGSEGLRLTGFHPPHRYRAALRYVRSGRFRKESFREFLAAPAPATPGEDVEVFSPEPYLLDRSHVPAELPLVVFFEAAECPACTALHEGPLRDGKIGRLLERLESVRLDMWSDVPVLTPGGERLGVRQWADRLGIFQAPTLVFFDRRGREILRLDSLVSFYRLNAVLEYVVAGAYRETASFQRWVFENGY